MDKEDTKISSNENCIEDDQDEFEDALEESIDEIKENELPVEQIVNSTLSTNPTSVNNAKESSTKVPSEISNNKNSSPQKGDVALEQSTNEINNNGLTLEEKISNFKVYTIEDGIDKCIGSAFKLNQEFFNDEFEFVLEFCRLNYDKNIFYSLIYGTMYFIKTWMSFEQPEIHKCFEILGKCSEYVNSRRKVYSWSDMVKRVNYNDGFTDEQVHAEITYGELQVLIGATTFIKDQNFSSLFKGALKFKQGYDSFKFCREIYLHRTKWSHPIAKEEFKSNLMAGSGVFHLSLAMAPPRVTQILEFVGFTCDENYAVRTLRKSIDLENTIKSNYALIVMLLFNCYTLVAIGYGDYQLDEYEKLVKIFNKRHPRSLFTNYFIAKELQLNGELDKSILKFQEITHTSKDYLKQINNACNWELLFLHTAKREYLECAKIADVLRSCLWSPCVFTFIYGISLYMIKEKAGNLKLQDEIDECFREVPRLRRRLAGKSTPIEKLAMSKSAYYFSHDKKFVLPMHELMFYYNLTCTFMRNKSAMNENLKIIEDMLKEYDVNKLSKLGQTNDYCLLLTLKGSYLRHLNFPSLAIETLEQIFPHSKEIEENHLLPFATQELGFCYIQLEDYEYAKQLLKSCIKHSKYTAELILHFRSYNALRQIKKKLKEANELKELEKSDVQQIDQNSINKNVGNGKKLSVK